MQKKLNADATSQVPPGRARYRTLLIYLAILCLSFGAYIRLVNAMPHDGANQADTPLYSRVDPNQTAVIKVSPATKSVDTDTTFTVTVQIEDALDLGAFQFTLTYDDTCVQATGVTLGLFLESAERTFVPVGPSHEAGSVAYGAWSYGAAPGPNGDGVLATVTFQAGTNTCSSALHLQDVAATKPSGVPLNPGTEDGQVTVGTAPAPGVAGITPNGGYIGDVLEDVIVIGENFEDGASVQLTKSGQNPISASWVEVQSSTQISCTLNLGKAVAGQWDVVVTNPDSQSGTLDNGFTVRGVVYLPSVLKNR